MSWIGVCLLVLVFVSVIFCAAEFAPPGYTLHAIAAVTLACTGLIVALPLDRKP